ncbi:MAG: 23S rRNA (pseudouridine(1915)-N(3))-methyltransferase RlmH [Bacteroidetes bacterium CG_4_8_14_3_um_filter_31_14]|nr:MAG: 23S rRNA (pseudouridine(1915)-N(3))-methyltransferase RlmH [Bacteroidetes bacterium CG_4_8_14_3_um_filter_31_14]
MKILLLVFGKTDEDFIIEAIKHYEKRIKHFFQFEIEVISEPKLHGKQALKRQLDEEAKLFKSKIKDYDNVFLLDENGKELSSVEFAKKLEINMNTSKKRLVFIIGGPYGFSQSFKNKYSNNISLSKMTFTHQMVRLIFIEQLYRAATIIKGLPYQHY